MPGTGKLRFIEVKGTGSGRTTVTVTKNEVLTSLNKPEDYILAIVEFQTVGLNRSTTSASRFAGSRTLG